MGGNHTYRFVSCGELCLRYQNFTLCLKRRFFEVELCDTFFTWMVPSPCIIYFHPRRLNLLGFSGYPTFYNHNQPLVLSTNQPSTTNLNGYPSIASAGLCEAWCPGTLWFTLRREQCQLGTWTFARTGGRGQTSFLFGGFNQGFLSGWVFVEVNLEPLKMVTRSLEATKHVGFNQRGKTSRRAFFESQVRQIAGRVMTTNPVKLRRGSGKMLRNMEKSPFSGHKNPQIYCRYFFLAIFWCRIKFTRRKIWHFDILTVTWTPPSF